MDATIATGAVDKEALDHLDRLSKLAAAAKPQRRWLIPVVAFALLSVFVGLLVKEQHETEIELDLAVTDIHFHLPRKGPLTDDQFLRSFNASALDGIVLDGSEWPAPPGRTCSVLAELKSSGVKEDFLTLPALVPPKDWELGVSRSGTQTQFEFIAPVAGAGKELEEEFAVRVTLRGQAVVVTDCNPEGKQRTSPWNGPGSITLRIGVDTVLRSESASPLQFARQIEFENLRLYADERFQSGSAPVDRRRSSVLMGTLYFDSLNAKAVSLRPFQDLSFGSSKGYIRAISPPLDEKVATENLRLQAHATVQKMQFGAGANQRSQMPSWLELIAAQTGIALLWASVLYVFGIVYAVLRWFKVTS